MIFHHVLFICKTYSCLIIEQVTSIYRNGNSSAQYHRYKSSFSSIDYNQRLTMTNLSAARSQTLKLGLIFLVSFTGMTSYSNIMSFMFQSMNMPDVGPAGLFVRYLTQSIVSLVGPSIPLGLKRQLMLTIALVTLNFVFGVYTLDCKDHNIVLLLVCLGAFFEGIGMGLYWICRGRFMHLVCQIYNIHDERGSLFGLAQMLYSISGLVGCVATFVLIGFFSFKTYFMACIVLGIISLVLCQLFLDDIEVIAEHQLESLQYSGQSQQQINRQKEVIEKILNEQSAHVQVEDYSLYQKLKIFFGFVPIIYYLFPFLIVQGISNGIKFNLVPHLVPQSLSKLQIKRQTGICEIFMGIGGVIGGYGASYMTDVVGTMWTCALALGIFSLECWLFFITTHVENLTMAYHTAFIIGLGLSVFQGLLYILHTRHLGGGRDVFGLKRLVFSIAMMSFEGWMTGTHNQISFTSLLVFSLLPILTLVFLQKLPSSQSPITNLKKGLPSKIQELLPTTIKTAINDEINVKQTAIK